MSFSKARLAVAAAAALIPLIASASRTWVDTAEDDSAAFDSLLTSVAE